MSGRENLEQAVAAVAAVGIAAAIVNHTAPTATTSGAGGRRGPIGRIAASIVPSAVELIDLNQVMTTVDLDALLDQIDLDALLDRIDINRIVQQVDIDEIVSRVDVNRIVKEIDLDEIVEKIDIQSIVDDMDLPALVAANSIGVGQRVIDSGRAQVANLDFLLDRLLSRLRLRGASEAVTDGDVTGRTVGPVARLLAYAADTFLIGTVFALSSALTAFTITATTRYDVDLSDPEGPAWSLLLASVWFLYFFAGYVVTGRTVGKALLGIRVLGADRAVLGAGRAFIRVLTLPVSIGVFGLGLVGIVVQREHRALHDLLAGTVVVHDWGDRPASLSAAVAGFAARHPLDADPSGDAAVVPAATPDAADPPA